MPASTSKPHNPHTIHSKLQNLNSTPSSAGAVGPAQYCTVTPTMGRHGVAVLTTFWFWPPGGLEVGPH
jgi:hypothetical protein